MSLIHPNLPNQFPVYPVPAVEQNNLSPVTLLEAGFRQSRLWVWTFGVIVLAAIVVTGLTRKQYQSEMNIIVQNARGTMVITPERTNGAPMTNGVTEEQVNSEMEVLRSKEVAEATVDPLWQSTSRTEAQSRAHDKAVDKFRKNLAVELIRKSNVIHVTYTAKSPEEAQDMLKRLLNAFMSKQREIELPGGASSFFAEQVSQYKKQLEAAQRDLASFQQRVGLVSLPERETQLEKEVSDLESERRLVDLQLADATHRLSSNETQLRQIPNRQSTIERTVPYQTAVEQLNTLLAQLKNKREELLTKYVPTDRLVVENERQIENTTNSLVRLNDSSSREKSTDVNPLWQQVQSAVAISTSDVSALKAKQDGLVTQISKSKADLSNIEGMTVDYSALRHRVTELENNYQLYTQKRDEAAMAAAMDQQKLLNVAVAELPTISFVPIKPRPILNIALGIFTAIFVACCAVFFAEMGRDTVSNARELENLSRYPVLASVPAAHPLSPDHMNQRALLKRRMPHTSWQNKAGVQRSTF
jgi:uncharacterized protein involved in exopolysaccharide biosynthesis